jgi:aldehyde:ferredoxin oxidoreductase
MNAAGSCLFGGFSMPQDALAAMVEAVTGWDFTADEMLRTGKRIMNMRHAFNLREGHRRSDSLLPGRCVGEPPLSAGPLKGVTVDHRSLADDFFESIGWHKETLVPTRQSLQEVGGMDDVIRDLGI